MPSICFCKKCEQFRDNMPEDRLTQAAIEGLDKANVPSNTSRRARIKAGVGKSGEIKETKGEVAV